MHFFVYFDIFGISVQFKLFSTSKERSSRIKIYFIKNNLHNILEFNKVRFCTKCYDTKIELQS